MGWMSVSAVRSTGRQLRAGDGSKPVRLLLIGLLSLPIPQAAEGRLAQSPGPPPGATSRSLRAGTSPVGVGPGNFTISPDSQYVVFWTTAYHLFSQRLRDGARIQIGPPPACSRTSSTVAFSPDSQSVLFLCSASSGDPWDLWVVPIEGPSSAALRLSLSTDPPAYLPEFQVAPDGKRVLYTLRTEPDRIELYGVPIAGPASTSVLLSSPTDDALQVRDVFALTTSSGVTYRGELGGPGPVNIWLTDLDTPVAAPIGVSLPSHPIGGSYLISPDEQHIVWLALSEAEVPWLFSAPISVPASPPILLNATSPESSGAISMLISPDSSRVAFVSNPSIESVLELFSVPIIGPAASAVNLSGPTQAWNPNIYDKQFSLDGAWIIYVGEREVQGRRDLYRVPASGPAAENVRINPIDPIGAPAAKIFGFEQLPGTSDVVFAIRNDALPRSLNCYRGSLLGPTGNASPLWTEPLLVEFFANCRWVEPSQGALAIGLDPASDVLALWLAHGDGPPDARPKKLFDATPFGTHDPFHYNAIELSPDGRYVVYGGTLLDGEEGVWSLPLPFFWDGFDSSGTAHWSQAAP